MYLVILLGLTTGYYAWQIEPTWIQFVNIKMPIKNLPTHLEGKRLVQISDLHIADRVDEHYILDVFKQVSKLDPDYVVYTGDFISLVNNQVLYGKLAEILKYHPRGSLGTIAILGNHDYGINFNELNTADSIENILRGYNITILRNTAVERSGLHFIGLDDY